MSEWKEHDGGPCPPEVAASNIEVELRCGITKRGVGITFGVCWADDKTGADIQRYRVLRNGPQALFGPYGYLVMPPGLNEESWTLEREPITDKERADGFKCVALYAQEEPFFAIAKRRVC